MEFFYDYLKQRNPDDFPLIPDGAAEALLNDLPKGTTVIAFATNDGAVMASDGRTSAGHEIWSEQTKKVHQLGQHTLIGSAGLAMLCNESPRIRKTEFYFKRCLSEEAFTFD